MGFEGTRNARGRRTGRRSGQFSIEMVTLENGGIVKSVHGNLYKNSIWRSPTSDRVDRDLWRNDTACTNPKVAGDML